MDQKGEMRPWDAPDFDDNPEWTDEDFAKAKVVKPGDFPPRIMNQLIKSGGRPKSDDARERISIRLPASLVEKMRATGAGWSSRAAKALEREFGS